MSDVFDEAERWLRESGWTSPSPGRWEFVDKRQHKTWTSLQGATEIQHRRDAAKKGQRRKQAPSALTFDEQDRLHADLSTALCVARNEYDDERDGDLDDYMAGAVMAALSAFYGVAPTTTQSRRSDRCE